MKHTIIICSLLLFAINANSQTTKGLSVPKAAEEATVNGKTYALIVGVSKYKNPAIPQLQYADKDAMAFSEYLEASGVDANNISLLLNEHATDGDFWADINDITEKAQKGDKVFFYFSGHGDVESKVITQDAYLLPYDAPKVAYASGAIGIYYLKGYLATLSSKGVQVIFITDACHSGNLAGGREGMENAANVLKGQWKDEIKILSCEPGELSLEGKQWGNGRGLFSYELIKGMAGDADNDKDGKVSLRELNIYMMQKVPDQANPMQQNPVLAGNMSATISTVNNQYLASHTSSDNLIAAVSTRGIEDGLLKGLPDSIKHFYADFKYLLEKGHIDLWAEGFTESKRNATFADPKYKFLRDDGFDSTGTLHIPDSMAHYYKECTIHNDSEEYTPELDDMGHSYSITHRNTNNTIKKYRISAFDYINKIPENDQTKLLLGLMRRNLIADEINKIESCVKEDMETDYAFFFRYDLTIPSIPELQMLTDLLGTTKLKEMGLLPKLYYIKGRLNVYGNNKLISTHLTPQGLLYMDSVLIADPLASYALVFISFNYYANEGKYDSAIQYAHKALSISPNSTSCYYIIGKSYRLMDQIDSSILYFKKLEKIINNVSFNNYIKTHLNKKSTLKDSIQVYNDARYTYGEPVQQLFISYQKSGQIDSEKKYSKLLISMSKSDGYDSISLINEINCGEGFRLYNMKNYIAALEYFLKARDYLNYDPEYDIVGDFRIAGIYSLLGDNKNALLYLGSAIKLGTLTTKSVNENTDLDNIRSLPEFKNLMDSLKNEKKLSYTEWVRKSCEKFPSWYNYWILATIYRKEKKFPEAERCFKKSIELCPKRSIAYIGYAKLYIMKNDTKNALKYLDEGFKRGYDYDDIKSDNHFDNIRATPQFMALVKKYFPNEYKE